jgi:hypothetical protein
MADTDTEQLTRKQEAALVALLSEGTVKAASLKCGTSETTLWRWLREPTFASRYRDARQQLMETTIARLQSASDVAVTTLIEISSDKAAAPTARIAAARAILANAIRGGEASLTNNDSNQHPHPHLCGGCNARFDCKGKDCENFAWARCSECTKDREKQRGKDETDHAFSRSH